jgi:hypothetical protein
MTGTNWQETRKAIANLYTDSNLVSKSRRVVRRREERRQGLNGFHVSLNTAPFYSRRKNK